MRIWIIGAEGMLGSTLSQLCHRQRLTYTATGRSAADVTHLKMLEKIALDLEPTHIINCAAYTDVDRAEKESDQAFAINAVGAENVAIVARSVGAFLLHLSTDYVFDGVKQAPYQETDRCNPINQYGKSKWEAEKRVLSLLPQACIVRTSWLFGSKGKNMISSLLHWMKEKEVIQVVSDQRGCPTYCEDLAEVLISMLNSQGVFHFANTSNTMGESRYEIAVAIKKIAEDLGICLKCQKIEPVNSACFPTVAKRPFYSVLDTSKITEHLGKRPRPWQLAFKDYLTLNLCPTDSNVC